MCPSCHSNDISRSKRHKLRDSFMRWMGKVAYRCRDCRKRFYVNIDIDRRLRRAEEWKKRSAEHASSLHQRPQSGRNDFDEREDLKA